jgi:hypothetical protein
LFSATATRRWSGPRRQIVQRDGDQKVVGSEGAFEDREAALVKWLGFGIAAVVVVQLCQVDEAVDQLGVIAPERLFTDRQDRLRRRDGLRMPPGAFQ